MDYENFRSIRSTWKREKNVLLIITRTFDVCLVSVQCSWNTLRKEMNYLLWIHLVRWTFSYCARCCTLLLQSRRTQLSFRKKYTVAFTIHTNAREVVDICVAHGKIIFFDRYWIEWTREEQELVETKEYRFSIAVRSFVRSLHSNCYVLLSSPCAGLEGLTITRQ